MGSLTIVEVQPAWKVARTIDAGWIDAAIGPFAKQRLDEALGLTVGLRPPRPGAQMPKSCGCASFPKAVRSIAGAVIGEDTFDDYALTGEPDLSSAQKCGTALAALVGQDLDVSQSREVIDGDVQELPASAAADANAITGNAMSGLTKAAELLDVQMHDVARMPTFVAAWCGRRFDRHRRAKPVAGQHRADCGAGEPELMPDRARRLAKVAQEDNHLDPLARERMRPSMRARWTIAQRRRVGLAQFLRASQPLMYRLPANTDGVRDRAGCPALIHDAPHQERSTARGSPGILMDVHPGYSSEVDWLAPISFSGLPRVNNPHRNHS